MKIKQILKNKKHDMSIIVLKNKILYVTLKGKWVSLFHLLGIYTT